MAGQKECATSLGAVNAILVNEAASAASGTADTDVVLLTLGGISGSVSASDTGAVKEVVKVTVLEHEGTLLAVVEGLVEGELVGRRRAGLDRALHLNLLDVVPEGAEVEVVLAANANPVGIDPVVVAVGRDADRAVIGPGAGFHSRRGSHTDFRVLGAGLGEDVVHVVLVVLEMHVRGLVQFVSNGRSLYIAMSTYPNVTTANAVELDDGALGQSRAHVLPGTLHGVTLHSVDTGSRSKTEVLSIRLTLDHGRVVCPAVTSAGTPVGVGTSQRNEEEEQGKHYGGRRMAAGWSKGLVAMIILEDRWNALNLCRLGPSR